MRAYPDPPREIEYLAGLVSCGLLDLAFFQVGDAIDSLPPKVIYAQDKILGAFFNARLLQVNYPIILPHAAEGPAVCGGIKKGDVSFARRMTSRINEAVAQSAESSARVELVDVEDAFGDNALCPSRPAAVLANGIDQANLRTELRRLLNLSVGGDPESRRLVDKVVDDYDEVKRCAAVDFISFGIFCDVSAAIATVKASALDLVRYLQGEESVTIFANLMAPPGSTSENEIVRFDRSRGLFHPNAAGQDILACYVRSAHAGLAGCLAGPSGAAASSLDSFDGAPLGNAPLDVVPGSDVSLRIGGFAAGSNVDLALYSRKVPLGSVAADSAGVVETSVLLPQASPGVHALELEGTAANGVGVTQRVLVRYPGRPSGGDGYATYLCCFDPEPAEVQLDYAEELVDITYLGEVFTTLIPDEDGGVLVELPLVDPLTVPGGVDIQARSQRTGQTLGETVDPVPSVAGLCATGAGPGALEITGLLTSVNGLVHSEGDLTIKGILLRLTGGVEHVGKARVLAPLSTIDPQPLRVAPGGSPVVRRIDEFRPGSPAADAAGTGYKAVDPAECAAGSWRPAPSELASGIVYVPCAVELTTANARIGAVIAAEGPIRVVGRGIRIEPDEPGSPALVSGAADRGAITVIGANVSIGGGLFAPSGGLEFLGLGGTFRCGVVAETIRVVGAGNRFVVDEGCLG